MQKLFVESTKTGELQIIHINTKCVKIFNALISVNPKTFTDLSLITPTESNQIVNEFKIIRHLDKSIELGRNRLNKAQKEAVKKNLHLTNEEILKLLPGKLLSSIKYYRRLYTQA